MRIGDLEVRAGEKKTGWLQVAGCDYKIPLIVICKEENKTTLITAGIHNAEYVGIQAAIELGNELQAEDIEGTVIIVPVVNVSGFRKRTMSLVYEDRKNLNREFPGKADGTIADRFCYTVVQELFSKADYYIDLHCGDGFENLIPYVYYVGPVKKEVRETALSMARHVDVEYIVESQSVTGGAYNYANSLGIPSILLERGGRGIWSREEVEQDKRDVRNVLAFLFHRECTSGLKRENAGQMVLKDVVYEYSEFNGCWYPFHHPGDRCLAGEVLGEIRDYFGKLLYTCRAERDAVILYQTSSLSIPEDSPMIAYGILE